MRRKAASKGQEFTIKKIFHKNYACVQTSLQSCDGNEKIRDRHHSNGTELRKDVASSERGDSIQEIENVKKNRQEVGRVKRKRRRTRTKSLWGEFLSSRVLF